MNLGGSITRQAESDSSVSDSSPHIANIGRMIEVPHTHTHTLLAPSCITLSCHQEMENKIRSTLNEIYFGKTKDIVNDLRLARKTSYIIADKNGLEEIINHYHDLTCFFLFLLS